jgi:hypothetical protein
MLQVTFAHAPNDPGPAKSDYLSIQLSWSVVPMRKTRVGEYRAENWQAHVMGPSSGRDAFHVFEDIESEQVAVEGAIAHLVTSGIVAGAPLDEVKYSAFCDRVRTTFDIPWTGISPRMRRAIYAINAAFQPQRLVCAGIFCGYTFICNVGASIGPGRMYSSTHVVGLEILPREATRACNNCNCFMSGLAANIICADASEWLADQCNFNVDLLYIDAKSIDFDPKTAGVRELTRHSEYWKIINSAVPRLRPGALVLAHNSVNASREISDYLEFVRGTPFQASENLIIDDAGLEVSLV